MHLVVLYPANDKCSSKGMHFLRMTSDYVETTRVAGETKSPNVHLATDRVGAKCFKQDTILGFCRFSLLRRRNLPCFRVRDPNQTKPFAQTPCELYYRNAWNAR